MGAMMARGKHAARAARRAVDAREGEVAELRGRVAELSAELRRVEGVAARVPRLLERIEVLDAEPAVLRGRVGELEGELRRVGAEWLALLSADHMRFWAVLDRLGAMAGLSMPEVEAVVYEVAPEFAPDGRRMGVQGRHVDAEAAERIQRARGVR